MQYRTVADLAACIRTRSAALLPRDIDLVVGIPQSGMLAANLISLRRNVPVTDVEGYLADRPRRAVTRATPPTAPGPRQILLVDDSVTTGLRCEATRKQIAATVQRRGDRVTTLAIYGVPGARGGCDVTLEEVPLPRLFEWSYMRHAILADACVHIEGVLCRNPEEAENVDGARYRSFLKTAAPVVLPGVEVGWLVTCRPERYRALTEDWLRRHGVRYRSLVMMDRPDKHGREHSASPGRFKADAFRRAGARLFVESDPDQAGEIATGTGLPVLCTGNNTLLEPASPSG